MKRWKVKILTSIYYILFFLENSIKIFKGFHVSRLSCNYFLTSMEFSFNTCPRFSYFKRIFLSCDVFDTFELFRHRQTDRRRHIRIYFWIEWPLEHHTKSFIIYPIIVNFICKRQMCHFHRIGTCHTIYYTSELKVIYHKRRLLNHQCFNVYKLNFFEIIISYSIVIII